MKVGARYLLGLTAVVMVLGLTGCSSTPQAGEIGVVRNGSSIWPLDWFDNHNIRGHVLNGSSTSWTGLGSDVHYYPVSTQQRFIKLLKCYGAEDCDADSPAVTVPTGDGVEATVEGTIYLNTVFNNSPAGLRAMDSFDTQFSTRTFGSKERHAYDGSKGWSDFLTAIVEPIVANNLRETISGTSCADLVSSCALVQNAASSADKAAQLVRGKNNQGNVGRVQDTVARNLADDLESTLGGRAYFGNISFKLTKVTLPPKVQGAIDDAQSAFAAVSQAQAKVQSARADADANRARQKGYNACPACRQIDSIKAWRGTGVTTVVLGGNAGIAVR
jgi:flavin-binding protein dodecin